MRGLILQDCPELTGGSQLSGSHVPSTVVQVGYKVGGTLDIQSFARRTPRSQENSTLTIMVYYKDPHEQPDEEARECGRLCPRGLGMCPPWSTWTCSPLQKLCGPPWGAVFTEAS